MRGPDDFDRRWEASRRELDQLRAEREAQFDRWTRRVIAVAAIVMLALFGAAVRWLLYIGYAA